MVQVVIDLKGFAGIVYFRCHEPACSFGAWGSCCLQIWSWAGQVWGNPRSGYIRDLSVSRWRDPSPTLF